MCEWFLYLSDSKGSIAIIGEIGVRILRKNMLLPKTQNFFMNQPNHKCITQTYLK